MPERRYTKLLEVFRREVRQDRLVYLIFAECRLVLPKAQAPQPDHNVHRARRNQGWRASSAGEASVSRGGVGVLKGCRARSGLIAIEELRYSIVVHLWEKVASTFGCHVKEAPKRINKIAGAMVLLRGGRSETHL